MPTLVTSVLPDSSPQPAAPAERPRLQPETLQALRALDPTTGSDFLRRVLTTYLTSLDKHLVGLPRAVQDGDRAAFVLSVHSLKSASASIGALAMSQSCATHEAALRGPDADAAWQSLREGDGLAALLALGEQTRVAVQDELREMGA